MNVRKCVDDLLIRGLDDWLQAAEVASVARTIGAARTESEVRALSVQVVRDLLQRDFMVVGTVAGTEFTPWGIAMEDALERIEREWRARPEGPNLGDICWLNLTERGSGRAEDLRSRSREEDS